jgi:hypothetical protein
MGYGKYFYSKKLWTLSLFWFTFEVIWTCKTGVTTLSSSCFQISLIQRIYDLFNYLFSTRFSISQSSPLIFIEWKNKHHIS